MAVEIRMNLFTDNCFLRLKDTQSQISEINSAGENYSFLRVGSQQLFPGSCCDFSLQPVHQRCDQSLLGVVGGEDQQHGVPGQTEGAL